MIVLEGVGIMRSASEARATFPFLTRAGKLGPIVIVETPEAEEAIREEFPSERPLVIRTFRGEKIPS